MQHIIADLLTLAICNCQTNKQYDALYTSTNTNDICDYYKKFIVTCADDNMDAEAATATLVGKVVHSNKRHVLNSSQFSFDFSYFFLEYREISCDRANFHLKLIKRSR